MEVPYIPEDTASNASMNGHDIAETLASGKSDVLKDQTVLMLLKD